MRRLILIFTIFLSILSLQAKAIDEAQELYGAGQYEEAIDKLKTILKATPKDATANYYLGLAYIALGEDRQAVAPLQKAADKSMADAWKLLVDISLRSYDPEGASEHLDAWEKQLKRNKKAVPDELNILRIRAVTMTNMMERVEKIVVIDSIVVDSARFFQHYRLSPGAGKLIPGEGSSAVIDADDSEVVFIPQNGKELFWSMYDDDGVKSLASAKILDNGKIEDQAFLGENLAQGGDSEYPYFTSDGMTFYYANNGENSIGGYDIFMSRRDLDGEVLDPQNIGMPYNSPYDDYMLVIDEDAGIGWWATDRNRIPGKVTIYVFVPSETRVNYDPEDPEIGDYARLASIEATQVDSDVDIDALLSNPILHEGGEKKEEVVTFCLPMGNGAVYTTLDDFRNAQAKQTMKQYLDREKTLQQMCTRVAQLRQKYGEGDRSVAEEILSLEQRIQAARPVLVKLRNQAITQERGGR